MVWNDIAWYVRLMFPHRFRLKWKVESELKKWKVNSILTDFEQNLLFGQINNISIKIA